VVKMPLETSNKSKEALSRNIERERHAGKSEKQSIAIAYSKKREAEERDHKNSVSGHEEYVNKFVKNAEDYVKHKYNK